MANVARPATFDLQGVLEAAQAMFTFSFVPHDWAVFHRNIPIFGMLFTLMLATLPWLRGTSRVWALSGGTMVGIFAWYMLSHYDRFLQTLLAWMAAVTAATMILLWQKGVFVRIALCITVAMQLVSGADTPFLPTHNLVYQSPLQVSLNLASSGYRKDKARLLPYGELAKVGRALPTDATVLAHDIIMILGIDRQWVTDMHQSRLSYGRLLTPRAIERELSALGVTHLVWNGYSSGRDNLAGDLEFFRYAEHYTDRMPDVGSYHVSKLRPLGEAEDTAILRHSSVANLSCGGKYPSGLYSLEQLTLPVSQKSKRQTPRTGMTRLNRQALGADFLVIDRKCHAQAKLRENSGFRFVGKRGNQELYAKRLGGSPR